MPLLIDSFWRAVAYCLRPRVIVLSLLPLVLLLALGLGFGFLYWDAALAWTRQSLEAWPLVASVLGWLQRLFSADVKDFLAPLLLVLAVTPVLAIVSLLVVAAFMAPALTRQVAHNRFAQLEKKHGASLVYGVLRSLGLTVLALIAMVVSMPLWLVPPLVLVLPPLIWGWLTARVMAFDALSEHASAQERRTLLQHHRWPLLGMGVLCGYLGAAPSIVWASGVLFAAAFFVLIPLAIWIYTVVFAFSALWFAHYMLDALARLRAQGPTAPALGVGSQVDVHDAQPGPEPHLAAAVADSRRDDPIPPVRP